MAEFVEKRITDHDFPPPFMWAKLIIYFSQIVRKFHFQDQIQMFAAKVQKSSPKRLKQLAKKLLSVQFTFDQMKKIQEY